MRSTCETNANFAPTPLADTGASLITVGLVSAITSALHATVILISIDMAAILRLSMHWILFGCNCSRPDGSPRCQVPHRLVRTRVPNINKHRSRFLVPFWRDPSWECTAPTSSSSSEQLFASYGTESRHSTPVTCCP